jgi:hypothetical protein
MGHCATRRRRAFVDGSTVIARAPRQRCLRPQARWRGGAGPLTDSARAHTAALSVDASEDRFTERLRATRPPEGLRAASAVGDDRERASANILHSVDAERLDRLVAALPFHGSCVGPSDPGDGFVDLYGWIDRETGRSDTVVEQHVARARWPSSSASGVVARPALLPGLGMPDA